MRIGENKPMKYIGNAFMALSFFILIFIYYPLARAYLFPVKINIIPGQPVIRIEKIYAVAPIVFNVDPWNKQEYQKALSNGVAHAKGTYVPGENGTVYLFAHSSDVPWRLTRYNTVFLRLNKLKPGDKISIEINSNTFTYSVREKKIVWPSDTEYLTNTVKNQLILQTCYPIGTDWKRLLVMADPV